MQRGIAVIPKSTNPSRLRENFAAAAIELSQADMQQIASLDQNYRLIDGAFWVVEGGPWTVQTIWDTP
jgi:alcohol dehydrogenase (NADP+)